eukprot:CAMPEP_0113627124 /NCGR_PEP_ID=MMETSP0017_2-20120614/14039_1 /TAXON_ID=2856 /ORGANISM="Cylindrotheca closterium" /LENGTH=96 /DNA_ID=CAMNT_0000537351 /DNA_START=90 /DNA_END=377 /DNA_ORIENTATION=+ /assembly_acc=CAM_ASM_000147
MGAKPSSMKRTQSAAFGRLRIDSPGIVTPGSVKQSLQRRRELRAQQQASGATTANLLRPSTSGTGLAGQAVTGLSESSPLLQPPARQLSAIPSNEF